MAIYKDFDPNNPDVAQPGGSSIISGQGSAPSSSQAQASKTPDQPGNFVGLQQYLSANQPQSQKLGQEVQQNVQTGVSGAEKQIGDVGQQFQGAVAKNTLAGLDTAGQEAADITKSAAESGNVDQQKRFGEIATAKYGGPTSLEESGLRTPVAQTVQQASQKAQLTKDESGQGQLLRDIYKPETGYSAGENRLDTYLLRSPETQAKFGQVREQAAGLGGKLSEADINAQKYAEGIKQKTAQVAQAAKSGLESTRTGVSADVEKRLQDVSSNWQSELNKYKEILDKNGIGLNTATPEQIKALGLQQGQRIFNILNTQKGADINALVSQQAFDPNKVITQQEQARLAALDALANMYGGTQLNKYTLPGQAGTLTKEGSLDVSGVGKAAQAAQQAFESQIPNTQFSQGYNWSYQPSRSDLETLIGNAGNAASGTGALRLNLGDYLASGMQNVNQPAANPGDWGQAVTGASTALQQQILDYLNSAGYNTGVNAQQVTNRPVTAAVSTPTGSDNPTTQNPVPMPFVPQEVAQPINETVNWAKKRLGL